MDWEGLPYKAVKWPNKITVRKKIASLFLHVHCNNIYCHLFRYKLTLAVLLHQLVAYVSSTCYYYGYSPVNT